MKYPVSQIFTSIQGEGVLVGRLATFIRLEGCPLKCDWCDTKHAWQINPDHQLTSMEICDSINASMVVITGGEPLIHDLDDLINEIRAHLDVKLIAVETSGCTDWKGSLRPDWVSVSPKFKAQFEVRPGVAQLADEVKYVVDMNLNLNTIEKNWFGTPYPLRAKGILMPEGHPPKIQTINRSIFLLRNMSEQMQNKFRLGARLQCHYNLK